MVILKMKMVDAISIIERSREYIKQANHLAESRHDSYDGDYMDGGQYEIMQETEKLLKEIDTFLSSEGYCDYD